jgi:predicted phage terminase large subunit-like protein
MTRWSKRDLTAQVVKASVQRGGEEWEVIELPAIFEDEMWVEEVDEDGNTVLDETTQQPKYTLAPPRPLWPEFWSIEELLALKEELPVHKWAAQYMQNPTGAEGALIKKDWWKVWEKEDPPHCDYIIQSWDTAFSKNTRADYSACITLGVFQSEDEAHPQIILIDAFKERLEFPQLKQKAFELYRDFQPDCCIIEAKAAGTPLIFELRSMGIPVQDYTPTRGNDKITRVNAVADLFASKMIWAPQTRWADEVIEEFASFPAGEHDDLVDAMTQALLRFRQGGLVRLNSDEPDEPKYFRRRGKAYY